MSSVLILHPGEMGSSLAACLLVNDHQASWVKHGRSSATKQRAEDADLTCYATLDGAVKEADVVFSICPPEYAETVAKSVSDLNFEGIYVDANATSPTTTARVAALFGDNFVDGSVIGPPARQPNRTRLYLSGMHAETVKQLFADTYASPANLGPSSTAASALKMCYAAYTKGTSALLLNIRALAEANGVTDALLNEWSISQPDLQTRTENIGPSVSRKAWRFAAEMREIANTFDASGLPCGFHQGAADVYERLAGFKDQPPTPTSELMAELLNKG